MQKLVWINGNDEEINLTSGDYGITNWEGFSNVDLNVQSQQVPMQDGSVFLDALLGERQLSVTLAIQDNNDLEKRYQLKRELIHRLNPKLGEGYLIYTNDFISKRIKCVPKLPLFPNKNSNDRGTQKASLSWTACDPYWEDVEENLVAIKSYSPITVKNEGDVPCNLLINIYKGDTENNSFTVKNVSTDKEITVNNVSGDVLINTNIGNKNVTKNTYEAKFNNMFEGISQLAYSDKITIALNYSGFFKSVDKGISWTYKSLRQNILSDSLLYNDNTNKFYYLTYENSHVNIWSSSDGLNYDLISQLEMDDTGVYWNYIPEKGIFILVNYDGSFNSYSTDAITWTSLNLQTTGYFKKIKFIEDLNLYIAVKEDHIYTSENLSSWTDNNINCGILYDFDYDKISNNLIFIGRTNFVKSATGSTFTITSHNLTITNAPIVYFNKDFNKLDIFGITDTGDLYSFTTSFAKTLLRDGFTTRSQLNKAIYYKSRYIYYLFGTYYKCNNLYSLAPLDFELKQIMSVFSTFTFIYFNPNSFFRGENFSLIGTSNATENNNSIILRSEDEKNWNVVTNTYDSSGSGAVKGFMSNNQSKIIAYSSYSLYISEDKGVTWSRSTPPNNYQIKSIIYNSDKNIFVMLCYNISNYFYSSANGYDWELISEPSTSVIKRYATGFIYLPVEHKYYIISSDLTASSIKSSSDLITFNYEGEDVSVQYSSGGIFYYIKELNILIAAQFDRSTLIIKNLKENIWEQIILPFNETGYYLRYNAKGVYYIGTINKTYTLNKLFSVVDVLNLGSINSSGNNLMEQDEYSNSGLFELKTTMINEIDKITSNSNMNLNLEIGDNELLLTSDSNSADGSISYRQKYLGV